VGSRATQRSGGLTVARLDYPFFRQHIGVLINDMAEGALRIRDMVRDLKTFARGDDEGRLKDSVDVNEMVRACLRLLHNRLKHHEVRERLDPELPLIRGNASQLEQVFVNTVANAADALGGRTGGAIEISSGVEPDRSLVRVTITDNDDEIGELDLPVQAKLLRVLQSGEYFRLGSTQKRGANVRIVAATNKDLSVEMEAGRFRRDLYCRLNISSIFLPPLRERRGDVKLCAYWFLRKHCLANQKTIHTIADDVMELLESYDYPGNVRELENIVAGAVVLETGTTLRRESLPPDLIRAAMTPAAPPGGAGGHRTLAEVEAEHIRTVMAQAGGNRTLAAQILGISRVGLLGKMKRHGIEVEPAGGGVEGRTRKPHG
jgi:hypothetical protein